MPWRPIDQRLIELQSDQMTGFHIDLLQAVPVMAAPDEASANMLVERFRQIPRALEQAAERFLAGAGAGRTPAAVCVTRSVNMIEGYLTSSLDDDVFVSVGGPEGLGPDRSCAGSWRRRCGRRTGGWPTS